MGIDRCPTCRNKISSDAAICGFCGALLDGGGLQVSVLWDRFRVEECLGSGRTGVVYRCQDSLLEAEVAAKLFHPEITRNETAVESFRRDVIVAHELRHPNVVEVYEWQSDGLLVGYTMAPLRGATLQDHLDGRVPGSPLASQDGLARLAFAAAITTKLAAAVDHRHAQGMAHGNLKPSGVMIVKTDRQTDCKLLEIEHPAPWNEAGPVAAAPTASSCYSAPEALAGHVIGPPGDLYSLAVIVYQVLTSRVPLGPQVDPPSQLLEGLPTELDEPLMACFAAPEHRPRRARELARALETTLHRFREWRQESPIRAGREEEEIRAYRELEEIRACRELEGKDALRQEIDCCQRTKLRESRMCDLEQLARHEKAIEAQLRLERDKAIEQARQAAQAAMARENLEQARIDAQAVRARIDRTQQTSRVSSRAADAKKRNANSVAVRIGASFPRTIKPGNERTARFAAFPPVALEHATKALKSADRGSKARVEVAEYLWRVGTTVRVSCGGHNLRVSPSVQEFIWEGRLHVLDFDVETEPDARRTDTRLKFDVSIEGFVVARLRLDVGIRRWWTWLSKVNVAQAEAARTAFASYATEDRDRVLDRIASLQIRTALDVWVDCRSLTPNVEWVKTLEDEIAARDLFLLFWSENAAKSEWVEKEWRRALAVKGHEHIEAHPLDAGSVSHLPRELAGVQLADPMMAFRSN